MKEAWSSVSLRHWEGLWWWLWELAPKVWEGSSRWGSLPALSVNSHLGEDIGHFYGDLTLFLSLPLLSLQDLSLCLGDELHESLSRLSCCSLDEGEHLLWHEGFLLSESVDTFCEEVWGDCVLDLEGSPSLLVELGTSPEVC